MAKQPPLNPISTLAGNVALETEYVGCYQDRDPGRTLPNLLNVSSNMTPHICRDLALGRHFRFYAVQHSTSCFAGNADPTFYGPKPGGCVATCGGNAALRCGGPLENMVYRLPDVNREYIGCFDGNVLASNTTIPKMTPTTCRAWALAMAFTHWGMQAPNVCRGEFLNTDAHSGPPQDLDWMCAGRCQGDRNQACGGSKDLTTAVYKIVDTDPTGARMRVRPATLMLFATQINLPPSSKRARLVTLQSAACCHGLHSNDVGDVCTGAPVLGQARLCRGYRPLKEFGPVGILC